MNANESMAMLRKIWSELTPQAKLILDHCQPHECEEGVCDGKCPDNVYEFSADIFVDACTMTERRYDGTPQAPD
jgi:hypothetical protein